MPEPLTLPAAFSLQASGELVSIVGGGGKTSLLFALAEQLPGKVVITTTTRIFAAQMQQATAVHTLAHPEIDPADYPAVAGHVRQLLAQHHSCLVVGAVRGGKALGVPPDLPGFLLKQPEVDFVLVEADGSRMRSIKAPATHEPVVPSETTLLVPVVGIDALDGRLADVAHRPEQIVALLKSSEPTISLDTILTPTQAATLVTHPQGGLKDAPASARVVSLINKVEQADQQPAARQIARKMLQAPRVAQVVVGALRSETPVQWVQRRVTAVVLAAGEGSRMGRTKQLLPWGDTTVLGQTLRQVKGSAVHDVVLVSGHEAEKVEAIAAVEGVAAVYNPHYATGEMLSSLQTAVRRQPAEIAAVLVVLADQPLVEPETINQLLMAYWREEGRLVAPVYAGQRGNPVLIDASFFTELLTLSPGDAPRSLLKRHPAALRLLPVTSESVLIDLDRPEEYERRRPLNKNSA